MTRTLAVAAAFMLAFSSVAAAAPMLDAAGKCRDNGKFVKAEMCKMPAKKAPCRDAKGKFAKCDAPGAKPAK